MRVRQSMTDPADAAAFAQHVSLWQECSYDNEECQNTSRAVLFGLSCRSAERVTHLRIQYKAQKLGKLPAIVSSWTRDWLAIELEQCCSLLACPTFSCLLCDREPIWHLPSIVAQSAQRLCETQAAVDHTSSASGLTMLKLQGQVTTQAGFKVNSWGGEGLCRLVFSVRKVSAVRL